jgi:hypothetical protein
MNHLEYQSKKSRTFPLFWNFFVLAILLPVIFSIFLLLAICMTVFSVRVGRTSYSTEDALRLYVSISEGVVILNRGKVLREQLPSLSFGQQLAARTDENFFFMDSIMLVHPSWPRVSTGENLCIGLYANLLLVVSAAYAPSFSVVLLRLARRAASRARSLSEANVSLRLKGGK